MKSIYEAVKYAVTLRSDIKIWSDNQYSLNTIANGSTTNKIAREKFKLFCLTIQISGLVGLEHMLGTREMKWLTILTILPSQQHESPSIMSLFRDAA
ncbi:hypothetical protein AVEN_126811-1 [Araneus ventricosus]|uniref:RNase H type-1 domain-containing protein n=1 Tax=Araneus ventricosus TaxID=182803 RepID=A0A4Y2VZL8_ARAVE|nr:hypothetical protein AVEN_20817-1 [Araneus ventricosus]GBO30142.1 hypothetical protein AVEN_71809-1 [Araneus ventricosus]GBO30147.1 hypothetical protein AVEN_80327-1 [Araneus ventricosus]GBO30150.1 hypothetical protein AVEN_126811-1 [Araneus ventricosus]